MVSFSEVFSPKHEVRLRDVAKKSETKLNEMNFGRKTVCPYIFQFFSTQDCLLGYKSFDQTRENGHTALSITVNTAVHNCKDPKKSCMLVAGNFYKEMLARFWGL